MREPFHERSSQNVTPESNDQSEQDPEQIHVPEKTQQDIGTLLAFLKSVGKHSTHES